jgi:PilZ domain-containing protein
VKYNTDMVDALGLSETALPNGLSGDGRRRGRRFELALKCHVWLPSAPAAEVSGVTVDISRSGLLVKLSLNDMTSRLPKPGEAVKIELDLPHSPNILQRCLECMTRAVRLAGGELDHPSLAFELCRVKVTRRDQDASRSVFPPDEAQAAQMA